MNNKIFSLLAAMSIALSASAQNAGKVTGTIKDGGDQKIIDAASISLLKAKDSSLAKVSLADKDGNFTFENVKEGTYLILATSVGHNKAYSNTFEITAAAPAKQVGT